MPSLQNPRGTEASLIALGASNNIKIGQIYLLTDSNRIAIGLSDSTYQVFAKLSDTTALQTANTTISPAKFGYAEFVLSKPGVQASNLIICQLSSNNDFDADEIVDFQVSAIAEVDQIRFTIKHDGPIVGDFEIIYQIGG